MMFSNTRAVALTYATFLSFLCSVTFAQTQTHVDRAVTAINTLNEQWYNATTGLWDKGWWHSACALTTLADFTLLRPNEARELHVGRSIQTTFSQAQKTKVKRQIHRKERPLLSKRGFNDFIDTYYDDNGHWAVALIRVYDATRDETYLEAAVDLFNNMQSGGPTRCGGGIYWNKGGKYINAVSNELYLTVAASLANRVPQNSTYLRLAQDQWKWFIQSNLINDKELINDGLTTDCQNNGLPTWSYNQGIVLGGLTELYLATKNRQYLSDAIFIAESAIDTLSNSNGILEEVDKCELKPGHCGIDGKQFKGVFVRNLQYLNKVASRSMFRKFILANANSIWANARDKTNKLGVAWTGPYVDANGASHGSAMAALVAAISVSQ